MIIIITKSMNIIILISIMLINSIYGNIVKTTCYRYKEYPYECDKSNNDSYLCEMKFHSDNYSSIHLFTGFQSFNNAFKCYYDMNDESYIYINQVEVEEINISFMIIYLFTIIIFYFIFEIRT